MSVETKEKDCEIIEVYGRFLDSGEEIDGYVAAIGKRDDNLDDDIFYWFASVDEVIGMHPDFEIDYFVNSEGKKVKKVAIRYLKSGVININVPADLEKDNLVAYCEKTLDETSDEKLVEGLKERSDGSDEGFFDETPEIEAIEDINNDYDEVFSSSIWKEYTKSKQNTFSVYSVDVKKILSETKKLLLDCNADWTPEDVFDGLFFKRTTLEAFLQDDYFDEKDKPSQKCLEEISEILANMQRTESSMLFLADN